MEQNLTLSEQTRIVKEEQKPGYARMSKKQLRKLEKPKVVKRRRTRRKAPKVEMHFKKAIKSTESVMKHILATPEERMAAIRRKQRL